MGTPEKNKSAIISNHFWIGKFEVTQEQWQSLMGNNPSKYKAENHRKSVIRSCKACGRWYITSKMVNLNMGSQV